VRVPQDNRQSDPSLVRGIVGVNNPDPANGPSMCRLAVLQTT
jgi:hypothetical protein